MGLNILKKIAKMYLELRWLLLELLLELLLLLLAKTAVCIYYVTKVLPSISIDNGVLLALQFGSICRNFGSVQWNRMQFRHYGWNAFAKVLDEFR